MVHHEQHHQQQQQTSQVVTGSTTATTITTTPRLAPEDETFKTTFVSKQSFFQSNMFRFLRFGSIDGSMLVMSALFGLSIDAWLASKIGARGYGPIIGAAVGNVLSDGVAAIPEGAMASVGALVGSSLPILPLGGFMLVKAPLSNRVKWITGAFSAAVLVSAFTIEKMLQDKKTEQEE